jgi:hypothetical protein
LFRIAKAALREYFGRSSNSAARARIDTMHLRLADYFLWYVTPLVQSGVFVVMYRRKLQLFYPWFFRYTILQVASVPILAMISARSYSGYYYAYYVNLDLSIILSFGVLYEASRIAFEDNIKLLALFRSLGIVAAVVALLWLVNANSAVNRDNGFVTDVMSLADRTVRLCQIALVVGLAMFGTWLGISRRSVIYGIILGFGFFAFVNMLIFSGLSHHGMVSQTALSRINALAYLISVGVWLAYCCFGTAEPVRCDFPPDESPTEREIREWIERNSRDKHLRMSAIQTRHSI